jgi:uncharacterized protein (DUF2384 family)
MVEMWNRFGILEMNATAFFDTVPKQDYLALYPQGAPDYQKVVKILDFKKQDVARASNVAVQSVRYDPPRMPRELAERIREWAVALNLVAQFFKDEQKTILWFKTPNPLLGNITPREMIRIGRFKKLHRFILSALSENEPK